MGHRAVQGQRREGRQTTRSAATGGRGGFWHQPRASCSQRPYFIPCLSPKRTEGQPLPRPRSRAGQEGPGLRDQQPLDFSAPPPTLCREPQDARLLRERPRAVPHVFSGNELMTTCLPRLAWGEPKRGPQDLPCPLSCAPPRTPSKRTNNCTWGNRVEGKDVPDAAGTSLKS